MCREAVVRSKFEMPWRLRLARLAAPTVGAAHSSRAARPGIARAPPLSTLVACALCPRRRPRCRRPCHRVHAIIVSMSFHRACHTVCVCVRGGFPRGASPGSEVRAQGASFSSVGVVGAVARRSAPRVDDCYGWPIRRASQSIGTSRWEA